MSSAALDNVRELKHCLACGSSELSLVLDLGRQPLANEFVRQPVPQREYPLDLQFCEQCTHLQLGSCVSRSDLFEDYLYVSGTTETLRRDFREFAEQVTDRHGVGRVLDIACNDGSQLDAFADLGWQTFGIDPARNLHELSSRRHDVICDFLRPDHLALGEFDVVVAQNVLAHTDDPLGFLSVAGRLGRTVYIQTSQANMVTNGEFDTIYHEHLSFFSEQSMVSLAQRAGLRVAAIEKRAIHGTSFLFTLDSFHGAGVVPAVMTRDEVMRFGRHAAAIIDSLRDALEGLKSSGLTLVGYGAAAKGMTVLNAVGVNLDCVIDDAPLKQGLMTPGMHIPIVDIAVLESMPRRIVLVPLAWNFADEIRERVLRAYDGNLTTVKYFPEVLVE